MNNLYPIEKLEEKIGYVFKDKTLLLTALTHSSYKNELEHNERDDYERLEFLGDAVLEFISSDNIFKNHTEMREGDMTSLRASLVCEPTLAGCAKEIGLSDYIILGRGEDRHGSRNRDSIMSDVFEAVIGAIYLDSGVEEAKVFIDRFILTDAERHVMFHDSKTQLQNLVQSRSGKLEYHLVDERGPEHAKIFTAAVFVDGVEMARAEGSSKKSAEQKAAFETLNKLRKE
ncbi:MAG: ribonuclease III [Lachnospiraceae bacterium]|nr:ribonuclease III [Lachnospiraceae bacterium]